MMCACSPQRNTRSTRAYHELTTRYNVFFNAQQEYDEIFDRLFEDYQDNYYDKVGSISAVASAVYRFYSMPYKNNIAMVRSIIDEITAIAQKGIKEVVITGIHVASYGKDFKEEY